MNSTWSLGHDRSDCTPFANEWQRVHIVAITGLKSHFSTDGHVCAYCGKIERIGGTLGNARLRFKCYARRRESAGPLAQREASCASGTDVTPMRVPAAGRWSRTRLGAL